MIAGSNSARALKFSGCSLLFCKVIGLLVADFPSKGLSCPV